MKRFKVYFSFNEKKMFTIVRATSEEGAIIEVRNKIEVIKTEELMSDEEMKVAYEACDKLKEAVELMAESSKEKEQNIDSAIDKNNEALNKLKESKTMIDNL